MNKPTFLVCTKIHHYMLIKIDREGLSEALSPQQARSGLRRAASLIIPILERGLLFAEQGSDLPLPLVTLLRNVRALAISSLLKPVELVGH
jgi:hypothetical protein